MTTDKLSFEAAMSRAEKIAATLSAGSCSLDDALPLYEQGIDLLARAEAELSRIEKRAKELVANRDGTLAMVDLDTEVHKPAA